METSPLEFAAPQWGLLLLLLPVLAAVRWWVVRRSRRLLDSMVAVRLRSQLLKGLHPALRLTRFLLVLAAAALIIVALMQPRRGYVEREATQRGIDLIVALDVSRSMLAEDVSPNRLARSRFAIQDLLDLLQGDRAGLVVFAGDAAMHCPLTVDYRSFRELLESVDTESVATGGTNLAKAIDVTMSGFTRTEGEERALILISDGEELDEDGVAMARRAGEEGLVIFTIGMGTGEGGRIPVTENGRTTFVHDETGDMVISKLDESRMREIAQSAGGFYQRFEGSETVNRLVRDGLNQLKRRDLDTQDQRAPLEQYQWPLGAGIALLFMSLCFPERVSRRPLRSPAAAAACIAGLLWLAGPAQQLLASGGPELYQGDQFELAQEAFEQMIEKRPQSVYRDRLDFGAGTAAFKSGRFDDAARHLGRAILSDDEALRAQARYNLGNTLFRQGEQLENPESRAQLWEEAIAQFEEAIAGASGVQEDATHNLGVVQRKLEALRRQQEQEQEQQEDSEQQEQGEEEGDPGAENEQSDQSESGDTGQEQGSQEQSEESNSDQGEDEAPEEPAGDGQEEEDGQEQASEAHQDNSGKEPADSGDEASDPEGGAEASGDPSAEGGEQQEEGQDPQSGDEGAGSPPLPEGASLEEGEKREDLQGDIEASNQQEDGEPDETAEVLPDAYELSEDGRISAAAARALLESLADEERDMRKFLRGRRQRVVRDW